MGFKNYYNNNKPEIHKEIEYIQKLDKKDQLLAHLNDPKHH